MHSYMPAGVCALKSSSCYMHPVSFGGPLMQHSYAMNTLSACTIYFVIAYLCQRRGENLSIFMYCWLDSGRIFNWKWFIGILSRQPKNMAKAGRWAMVWAWMRSNCNSDDPSWVKSTSNFFLWHVHMLQTSADACNS